MEREMNTSKLLLVATLGVAAAASQAQVIYDNFDFGMTYNTGVGYTISGPTSGIGHNGHANQFMSSVTAQVGTLNIAMGHVSGGNSVLLQLFADNAGAIGAEIGSAYSLTTNAGSFGGNTLLSVDVTTSNWNVQSGEMYWLLASDDGSSWHAWNLVNHQGNTAYFNGIDFSYGFGSQSAFSMEAVPEPASMLVLAGGAALMAAQRRKRA